MRRDPDVELVIEQIVGSIRCPTCGGRSRVKKRTVVVYIDLPL